MAELGVYVGRRAIENIYYNVSVVLSIVEFRFLCFGLFLFLFLFLFYPASSTCHDRKEPTAGCRADEFLAGVILTRAEIRFRIRSSRDRPSLRPSKGEGGAYPIAGGAVLCAVDIKG